MMSFANDVIVTGQVPWYQVSPTDVQCGNFLKIN